MAKSMAFNVVTAFLVACMVVYIFSATPEDTDRRVSICHRIAKLSDEYLSAKFNIAKCEQMYYQSYFNEWLFWLINFIYIVIK